MKRKLSLKALAAVLVVAAGTAASAQSTAYVRLRNAEMQLAAYKKYTPQHKNVKQPWYGMESTLQYTPSADGGGTTFLWDGGLTMNYYQMNLDHTSWDHPDCRNRPTGSTTISVSATGLTIKTYNDLQLATDFDERTGAPKVPADPFREDIGCRGGTAQRDFVFNIGQKRCTSKASVTCSHSHKVIFVSRSGRGRNRQGQMTTFGGQQFQGDAGNFLSPQKFMHTQTISLSFATMAKAAGMSETELFRHILDEGVPFIACQHFLRDAEYSFLNLLLYRMAARKCGLTAAQLRESYLQLPPDAFLASMQQRAAEQSKIERERFDLPDVGEIYTSESKAIMTDFTDYYRRLQESNADAGDVARVRKARLEAMQSYYGHKATDDAWDEFDATKADDPDPDVRNMDFQDLKRLVEAVKLTSDIETQASALVKSWQEPLLRWNGDRRSAEAALDGARRKWDIGNWIALNPEQHLRIKQMMADSLLSMYNTALSHRLVAKEHYLHWKDADTLTAQHLWQAALHYKACAEKCCDVAIYAALATPISVTDKGEDAEPEIKKEELLPADTIAKAKEMLWLSSARLICALNRLHYLTGGHTDNLLQQFYSLDGVDVDLEEVRRQESERPTLTGAFPKPYDNQSLRNYYNIVVNLKELLGRTEEDFTRYIYDEIEETLMDIDFRYRNPDLALARGEMIVKNVGGDEWSALKCRVYSYMAVIRYDRKELEAASEMAHNAIMQGNHGAPFYAALELRGLILLDQGKTKEARKWLKDTLMDPHKDIDWTQRPLYMKLKAAGAIK